MAASVAVAAALAEALRGKSPEERERVAAPVLAPIAQSLCLALEPRPLPPSAELAALLRAVRALCYQTPRNQTIIGSTGGSGARVIASLLDALRNGAPDAALRQQLFQTLNNCVSGHAANRTAAWDHGMAAAALSAPVTTDGLAVLYNCLCDDAPRRAALIRTDASPAQLRALLAPLAAQQQQTADSGTSFEWLFLLLTRLLADDLLADLFLRLADTTVADGAPAAATTTTTTTTTAATPSVAAAGNSSPPPPPAIAAAEQLLLLHFVESCIQEGKAAEANFDALCAATATTQLLVQQMSTHGHSLLRQPPPLPPPAERPPSLRAFEAAAETLALVASSMQPGLRAQLRRDGLLALVVQLLRELVRSDGSPAASQNRSRPGAYRPAATALSQQRSLLVRILANLAFRDAPAQDEVRHLEAIPLLLEHCNIDPLNPYLREWSILAVRNVCEGNDENQQVIQSVQMQAVPDDPMLAEMGLQLSVEKGRIRIQRRADRGADES